MTRTARFLEGLVFGYLFQIVVMVTGIWLTPFLLRHLGQHDYGLWLVGLQLLNYVSLVDFGVLAIFPREVARLSSPGEAALPLADLVRKTTKIVLGQALLVGIGSYCLWLTVPASWAALRAPLGWVLASMAAIYPLKLFPALLEGFQDLGFANRARLGAWAASTALTIYLVSQGSGLYSLAAGLILNQVAFSGIAALRLRSLRPDLFNGFFQADKFGWADFTRGAWVSIGQVAQLLLGGIDMVVIGNVLGPEAVVPYACTSKLIMVLQHQPHIIVQGAMPGLSQMKGSESRERIRATSTALNISMLLLSGWLATVILSINAGFIEWWVGGNQYAGNVLSLAFVVTMLARHFTHTLGYTLFCFGYERLTSISALVEGLVNLALAYIGTKYLGLPGIPLATLAAALFVALPFSLRGLTRELQVPASVILQPFLPVVLRSAVLIALAYGVSTLYMPHGPVALALTGLGSSLIYGLCMLDYARRPPLGRYIEAHIPAVRSWWLRPSPELPGGSEA